MASPAAPAVFFCFAAMVLLIFVSVSVPVWDKIYFLNATVNGGTNIKYGAWGYTGIKAQLGYNFDPAVLGFSNTLTTSSTLHNLTFTMILHPIAAFLSFLAFIFGLCGLSYHRAGTIIMSLLAGLATLVTLIVFIIDMCLWGIARNKIRDNAGDSADFGNANWITLGALVALLLGFCAGFCGSFGRYRRPATAGPAYGY